MVAIPNQSLLLQLEAESWTSAPEPAITLPHSFAFPAHKTLLQNPKPCLKECCDHRNLHKWPSPKHKSRFREGHIPGVN